MSNPPLKSFKTLLTEMPVEYKGEVKYMADDKFPLISLESIGRYTVLGEDDRYIYLDNHDTGYAFARIDVQEAPKQGIRPVLRVSLRDAGNGMKQAHFLRIREGHADNRVAKTWYYFYAKAMGGIVSDFEHLQGGKALWMSLIKTGHVSRIEDGKEIPVASIDADNLWSVYPDISKKNLILVYRP